MSPQRQRQRQRRRRLSSEGKSKTVSDIRMPPGNFSLLARARDHLGAEVRELQQGRNLPWVVNVVSKG